MLSRRTLSRYICSAWGGNTYTFTARSPAGSQPPRHGVGRGSQGGPQSVTSFVSVVEVSGRLRSGRWQSRSEYHLPLGRIFALSSILITHGWSMTAITRCLRISRNAHSTLRKVATLPGDDGRWLGVVLVIGNLSSRKKGGDHTQPPEVFGDRHGCRRRTDDMGDRAERKRDREPSARRLGLKLTESALLVPGRSAAAPHRGEGSRGRRRGRKTGWEGERRRKSENDVVERDEGEEGLGPYHRGPLQSTHRVPRASTIIS